MSFTDKLDKLSRKIRHRATGREFEGEGYDVRWDLDDGYPGYPNAGSIELTMERYKNGPGDDPFIDRNSDYYVLPGSEVWEHKFKTFDWWGEEITKFGKSYPSAMRNLIDSLKDMPNELCAEQGWKDSVAKKDAGALKPFETRTRATPNRGELLLEGALGELDNWSGRTAQAYIDTFGANGNNWTDIVQNDYYLAELLVAAAEAQLAVFVTARESITSIAEKTCEALLEINEGSGSGAQVALTIFGAILGTTLTVMSFGTASAFVGAAVTITNALVDQAESGGPIQTKAANAEGHNIEGDTVRGVLDSMVTAIGKVRFTMIEKQHEIRDALHENYNEALRNPMKFKIEFADSVKPATLDSLGDRDVKAEPSELAQAGMISFPNAAAPMLTVNATLAKSGGNWGEFSAESDGGVTSVHSAWIDLRDLLQDFTGANANKIKQAGEVLWSYAKDIGATDINSGEDIDEARRKAEEIYGKPDAESSGTHHEINVPPIDPEY